MTSLVAREADAYFTHHRHSVRSPRYFKKFVRSWNKGRLSSELSIVFSFDSLSRRVTCVRYADSTMVIDPEKFYSGISSASISAATSSAYSWNFKSATQRELDDAASIRKGIDSSAGRSSASSSVPARQVLGPSLPSASSGGSALEQLQYSRSVAASKAADARAQSRAAYSKSSRDARTEERDNQSTGRERVMEKRREGNDIRKEIRDSKEAGGMMEVDEETLMGGGASYQAMYALFLRLYRPAISMVCSDADADLFIFRFAGSTHEIEWGRSRTSGCKRSKSEQLLCRTR